MLSSGPFGLDVGLDNSNMSVVVSNSFKARTHVHVFLCWATLSYSGLNPLFEEFYKTSNRGFEEIVVRAFRIEVKIGRYVHGGTFVTTS
jgi:hypothetical protein